MTCAALGFIERTRERDSASSRHCVLGTRTWCHQPNALPSDQERGARTSSHETPLSGDQERDTRTWSRLRSTSSWDRTPGTRTWCHRHSTRFSFQAPAPVVEFTSPGPAVFQAPAPEVEYIQQAPQVRVRQRTSVRTSGNSGLDDTLPQKQELSHDTHLEKRVVD